MHRLTRTLVPALVVAFALVAGPCAADVLTVEQIVAMSKAGVSDEVILALIDRDKPVFAIEADRLVTLKSDGLSQTVVLAMLRSGRDPVPAQAPPPIVGPDIVIVGHGPEAPNTATQFTQTVVIPYLYVVPVLPSTLTVATCGVLPPSAPPPGPSSRRFTSDPSARFFNTPLSRTADQHEAVRAEAAIPIAECPPIRSRFDRRR